MNFFKICGVILLYISVSYTEAREIDAVVEFSQQPVHSNVKISPDGKYLAVALSVEGKTALGFLDRATFKLLHVVRFPGQNEVGSYFWVNNERVIIEVLQSQIWSKKPESAGELYAVNWDGSKADLIYGYRAGEMQTGSSVKKREAVQGWASIIDILPGNDKQILIASTPWSKTGERFAEIALLDVYTGKMRRVATAPAAFSRYLTDQQGELVLAVSLNSQNRYSVYRYNNKNKDWTAVPESFFGNDFFPVAVNDSGDGVYVLDDFGQDKTGLFELKLETFAYKPIFTDSVVSISDFETTKDTQKVFAMRLDDGMPTYALLSDVDVEAALFKSLLASFPGEAVSITSKTADNQLWVIHTSADTNPGTFFLYDRTKNSLAKLFDSWPNLAGVALASMQPVSFTSFDGRLVHGYFTAGKGSSEHKPLIVNVHGGPHGVRDYWGFDSEVQLLANAGYSVLQVNYRGSGGYGNDFLEAGYLQWGDAIQRDIIAGTQWAIAEGKAQAGNVCIMGASFGGYSAIQAAALAPTLYKCAVGVAGVYDLNIMRTDGDVPLRQFGVAFLDQVLGTDKARLDAHSPVNLVAQLQAALFIAHGTRDKRAPMEHAKRLLKALDSAGKPYHWLQFDDETHGFYSSENKQIYYRQLLAFFQLHLKQ